MALAAMPSKNGEVAVSACDHQVSHVSWEGGVDLHSEHVSGHIARMQQPAVLLKHMFRRVRAFTDGPSPGRTD